MLRFSELPQHERLQPAVTWTESVKATLTFFDAIALVRRHVWRFWTLESPRHAAAFQKLSTKQQQKLLELIA